MRAEAFATARRTAVGAMLGVGLLTASAGGAAEPPLPFGAESRVAHIAGALGAVGAASPALLKEGADYARVLDRGACSAGAARLRVECLLVAVQRYCHDRGDAEARTCALYMDVIVSNVLADRRLIPPTKRYEIIRANVDYRPALARELHRIEGTMAVDFRLRMGEAEDGPTMARNIDRYCLAGDIRSPALPEHDALSYQACVSALVWFIKGPVQVPRSESGPVQVARDHSSPSSESGPARVAQDHSSPPSDSKPAPGSP
jgi:hypothetical protein